LHNVNRDALEPFGGFDSGMPLTSRDESYIWFGRPPTAAVDSGLKRAATTSGPILDPDEMVDDVPLFFSPGKNSFYAPRPGKNSAERMNAFRNVGRMIGICLLQNELLPLPLCRHVFKYILGRPITWFDLAFYDVQLFESLRSVVKSDADPQQLGLTFAVDLLPEEGGQRIELRPNGADVPVTSDNVIDYIYRYVDYRLIRVAEKSLEQIRQGVFDVLPQNAMESLTAEDLRLLLIGVTEIETSVLQSYTTFSDESNSKPEAQAHYKRWFWDVVGKMTAEEKENLVYFWTGSAALPSSEAGFQPLPSVVIRPEDDAHLPTANTCISRLYVPLYSSKKLLKQKLLLAIKAKNFGFV